MFLKLLILLTLISQLYSYPEEEQLYHEKINLFKSYRQFNSIGGTTSRCTYLLTHNEPRNFKLFFVQSQKA